MGASAFFQRYLPGFVPTSIAFIAYFQAAGIMQLLGFKLTPTSAPPPAALQAQALSVENLHSTDATAILEHNPFDSVTSRPLGAIGLPVAPSGAIDLEHSDAAPSCDGMRMLIAVASPSDPAWSMAALTTSADPSAKLLRIGDDLAGRTLQRVEWNRVVLGSGSSLCQLQMFRGKASMTKARTAPPTDAGPAAIPLEIASKIRKVSATERDIDRAVIDTILEHQLELLRTTRIAPEQEQGRVMGIRLYGARPGTLLEALGISDGDRLEAINGFEIVSPERALEAYARLPAADHWSVKLNRHGQPMVLDFNIK